MPICGRNSSLWFTAWRARLSRVPRSRRPAARGQSRLRRNRHRCRRRGLLLGRRQLLRSGQWLCVGDLAGAAAGPAQVLAGPGRAGLRLVAGLGWFDHHATSSKLVQAGRTVVSEHQDLINDSSKGDKGFTPQYFEEKLIAKFKEKNEAKQALDELSANAIPCVGGVSLPIYSMADKLRLSCLAVLMLSSTRLSFVDNSLRVLFSREGIGLFTFTNHCNFGKGSIIAPVRSAVETFCEISSSFFLLLIFLMIFDHY